VFDRGAGDALAVDFERLRSEQRKHYLGGHQRWAVTECVTLALAPFDVIWEADVDFLIDDDWSLPYSLLGQEGFLDRWVVTFNLYGSYFMVESVERFEARIRDSPTS
jgi:hypothetical protein